MLSLFSWNQYSTKSKTLLVYLFINSLPYSSTPLIDGYPLKDQLIFAASELPVEQLASNQLPSNQMLLNQLPSQQVLANDFPTYDTLQGNTTLKPMVKSSLDFANKKEDEVIINNGLKADNDDHYKTLKVVKIIKKS